MAAAMKNAIYVGMIAPTTAVISAAIIAVITVPTAALITTATTAAITNAQHLQCQLQ